MNQWTILLLLAQNGPAPAPEQVNPLVQMAPMLLMLFFLWYFILFRPQKRESQRREQLLAALKKNDRVVTIGGIIGTIANISNDGKDVMLKVDDNTRIRMLRSSIQGLYGEDSDADTRSGKS